MKDIDVTDTKQQISSLNSENSLSYGHFKEVIFISMKNRILILTNRNWKGGNWKGTGAVKTFAITKKARPSGFGNATRNAKDFNHLSASRK